MKKKITIGFLLTILCLFLMGFKCETHTVEVPIRGTDDAELQVDEPTNTVFFKESTVNVSEMVDEIIENSEFEEDDIIAIYLVGVNYQITENEYENVTVNNGKIQAGETPGSKQNLIILEDGINLEDIEGSIVSPDLEFGGVTQISNAVWPLGDNQIYFRVEGVASSAPIKFKIKINVTIVVIAAVDVKVPMI